MSFTLGASELLIRPKAYLDMKSGKMVFNKIIRIENQKIKTIENDNKKLHGVLDLKDVYLLPGFIDCHTHLLFTQTNNDNGFEAALLRELKLSGESRIARAKVFMRQYLHEGFTGLCDLGNSGYFLDSRLKNETNKNVEYPKLYISGPGIAAFKGQFSSADSISDAKKEYTIINDNTDFDGLIKMYADKNVDILKLYLDNSPGEGGISEKNLRKILSNPLIKKFKKVTFHAIEKNSFDVAKKIGLKSLEHANNMAINEDYKDFLEFVTPTDQDRETLVEFNYFNKVFFRLQGQRLKFLGKTKINIVFGPDFYFHKENADFNRAKYVKRTINTYIEAGFSSINIIRALTVNPAKSLKLDNKIGIIAPGYMANLVGFQKNPLKSIDVLQERPIVINQGTLIK